jgi:hypothetical protein
MFCPTNHHATDVALAGRMGKRIALKLSVCEYRLDFIQDFYLLETPWFAGIEEIIMYDDNLLRKQMAPFDFDFVDLIRP